MTNIDISFIIPAFNSEKYIARTINSILNIQRKRIECIVVDDGSLDKTAEITKKFCQKFAAVKLIHKNNGGVSSARNIGIETATGKYICFVDADDVIEPTFFSNLDLREVEEADLCMFGYQEIFRNGKKVDMYPASNRCTAQNLIDCLLDCAFSKNYSCNYMGGKVYQYIIKKEFLINRQITFPVGMHFAEDMIFCLELFANIPKIYIIDEIGYYYYVLPNTASHKYRPTYWKEHLQILEKVKEIQNKYGLYTENIFFIKYNRLLLSYIKDILCHNARYFHQHCLEIFFNTRNMLHQVNLKLIIKEVNYTNWSTSEKILNILLETKSTMLLLLYYFFELLFYKIKRDWLKLYEKSKKMD